MDADGSYPGAELPGLLAARADCDMVVGVRQNEGAVVFVQPSGIGREVHVAGDFNQWSPVATPMPLGASTGMRTVRLDLPPGEYQYRLVVDGRWRSDPYNRHVARNGHGEPNSVLTVRANVDGSTE